MYSSLQTGGQDYNPVTYSFILDEERFQKNCLQFEAILVDDVAYERDEHFNASITLTGPSTQTIVIQPYTTAVIILDNDCKYVCVSPSLRFHNAS